MHDGFTPTGPGFIPRPARFTTDAMRLRKREAFRLLDRIGQLLEPTATQMERAESSYTAVGDWLADDPLLAASLIYVQGSMAHGTAVKPIGSDEHDVDLICHVPGYGPTMSPALLKKIVGDRLAANGAYAPILEEMARCWRLNCAGDFHLDITPSITNPDCRNGGELVPDRTLRLWKASHPKGFRDLFARRASLTPRLPTFAADGRAMQRAEIEAFPTKSAVKGVLRRLVQLLKRHRDVMFLDKDPALRPLSIIITALAARAYEWCVVNQAYDNELDLVCDTIRAVTWFIDSKVVEGKKHLLVLNETTAGENFAEKWNAEPRRAKTFYEWHANALASFEALAAAVGLDQISRHLSTMLGDAPVNKAVRGMSDEVGAARKASRLIVAPTTGLSVTAATGTPVLANTFHGR